MTSGRHTPLSTLGQGNGVSPQPGASGPRFGDSHLNSLILSHLEDVEDMLVDELRQGDEILTDKALHLVKAGGKRFRPMFCLLASSYGEDPMNRNVVRAAAVIEMTHLATLYHDDVMDEAERRRGVDSVNERWNNSVAILAGDHLIARASGIMADLGVPTIRHFGETFGKLVTGQMRETIGPRDDDLIGHYMRVIEEKTGVLIASAGYLGALHGGASEAHTAALQDFGAELGIVFQIVDDIIDIFAAPDTSGKQRGTDLKEGVITLPVVYAMSEGTADAARLKEILDAPERDELIDEALDLVANSGAKARALRDVDEHVARAKAALAGLPDCPATRALEQLADYSRARLS